MPNGVGQPDWQDSLISPAALMGLSPFVGLDGCERFTALTIMSIVTTIALFSNLCERLQLKIKVAFVSLSVARITWKTYLAWHRHASVVAWSYLESIFRAQTKECRVYDEAESVICDCQPGRKSGLVHISGWQGLLDKTFSFSFACGCCI